MSNGIKPYPKPASMRSGCKVSWYTYSAKAAAYSASLIARDNAKILEAQGYDFGYQSPGSVAKVKDGYEVVIP